MQWIDAAGAARLSSLVLDQRAAPQSDAAAVVMLHGLIRGNMASWYSTFAVPLSATRKVVLYDQRGHGDSSPVSGGFDLDTQADDLQAVLAHHRLDAPVDLVGHSMGALIALRFALRQPRRVRRLVLVDAPMPAGHHVAPSLLSLTTPAALEQYLDHEFAGIASGGRRRERLARRLAALVLGTTLIADVLAMDVEADAALAQLRCPVLLIYGRHSPCLASGVHLQRVLPDARLEQLDCGHYVPEEAPDALREQLLGFLSPAAELRA